MSVYLCGPIVENIEEICRAKKDLENIAKNHGPHARCAVVGEMLEEEGLGLVNAYAILEPVQKSKHPNRYYYAETYLALLEKGVGK